MSEAYRCNLYNTSARRAKSLIRAAKLTSSVQSHIGEQVVHQRKGRQTSSLCVRQQASYFFSILPHFFFIFFFLFEVKCSLRWQTTQRQKTGTVVFASLGCVKLPQLMLRRQQGSTSPLVLLTPPLFFCCWTSGAPEGAPP